MEPQLGLPICSLKTIEDKLKELEIIREGQANPSPSPIEQCSRAFLRTTLSNRLMSDKPHSTLRLTRVPTTEILALPRHV